MNNLEKLQKIASFRVDKIYDIKFDNGDRKHYEYETIRDFPEYFTEIEQALERLELYESNDDFYKDVIVYAYLTNEDKIRKIKALEIIKEKRVDISDFIHSKNLLDYNDGRDRKWYLTQEEYDLLKEILK